MIKDTHTEVETLHANCVRALGLPMLVPQSLYAENGQNMDLGIGRICVRSSHLDDKHDMTSISYVPNVNNQENVVTMQITRNRQTHEIEDATYEWQVRAGSELDPQPDDQCKVEWQLGYPKVTTQGKMPQGFYSIRNDLLTKDSVQHDPTLIYETFGKILAVIAADANESLVSADILLAQMMTYASLNRLGIVTNLTHLGIAQLNVFGVPAVIPTSLDNRLVLATLIQQRDPSYKTCTFGNIEPGTVLEIESRSENPHFIFVGGIELNEDETYGGMNARTVVHLANKVEEIKNPGPDEWLFCQMSVRY